MSNSIGQKILILRAGVGWTQQQLADRLDTTQRTVAAWENGESIPRGTMKVRLAKTFGLSEDYFLNNFKVTDEGDKEMDVFRTKMEDAIDDLRVEMTPDIKKRIAAIKDILDVKK